MTSSGSLGHAGMRSANLAAVLRGIAESDGPSRAELSASTGLTKSTVSALVADLLDAGLVAETAPTATGDRGRPSALLQLAADGAAGVGVEINVDYLAAVVCDLTGTARYRDVLTRDNRGRTPRAVLEDAADLTRRARAAAREQGLPTAGACLAVPGTVEGTTVRYAPNLDWTDVEAGEAVLGVTRVENEANLAALGELWFGADELGDFIHVSGEIGIGAGIVTGGRLFAGAHGRAGELGHVVVAPDGPRCHCGGHGCLERMAGQEAILTAAGVSTAAELLDRLATQDSPALDAVHRAGEHLGVALASACSLLDPDAVVLGGAFAPLARWLSPAITEAWERHLSADRPPPVVTASVLGSDAAVRGAAGSVIGDVIADPVAYLGSP